MRLRFTVSDQYDPFLNVAVEQYLLGREEADCVTMYLWQNRRTVVIGQNQNPYAECNVELLESEGGHVMRRRTGGGAVYHDDGNLNFSFVAGHGLYDQERQFQVICRAVESYGLHAQLSGRNDVLCEGRKFSGNAFAKGRTQNLHHGTLLIAGNMADLQRYLKVRPSKLMKHGVSSVQSRVVNLAELAPIDCKNIVPRLKEAFEAVYGQPCETIDFETLANNSEVQRMRADFASDEWRFGRWRSFVAQRSGSFEWGTVDIDLQIDESRGIIREVALATDSLQLNLADAARTLLAGASIYLPPHTDDKALQDIVNLVYGKQ